MKKTSPTGLDLATLVLSAVLLLTAFALLPVYSSPVEGAVADLEWDVSAECAPHTDVQGPQSMSVLFVPTASRDGIGSVSATLYPSGMSSESAIGQAWDFPQHGWHSVLFQGPPVTARFFCQDSQPKRNLAISYDRSTQVSIAASQTEKLSRQELSPISSILPKNTLSILADPDNPFYSAGAGTNNPYWLTISVPVHSAHEISTTVKYEFP